ncbi:MAG: PAS domain-containing protein [Armatimonadetes bacterium]|nr:PAS domain-containing protein [Armatimonadota bacterium]
MPRLTLLRRLLPLWLLAVVLPLTLGSLHAASTLRHSWIGTTRADLTARLSALAEPLLASEDLAGQARQLGRLAGERLTLLDQDGRVLADSLADPGSMENHTGRPELSMALRGQVGHSIRHSNTLGQDLLYVALPVKDPAGGLLVLRGAVPTAPLQQAVGRLWTGYAGLLALSLAVAGLAAVSSTRRLGAALNAMRAATADYARGHFDHRLPALEPAELGELADSLNAMATALDDRLALMLEQRRELEAVLDSMAEAVLAVDADDRVLWLNPAAAELFGLDPSAAQGRTIHELIRNTELQRFVARALASPEPVEGDLVLEDREERFLQATGARLFDREQRVVGVVVVLNNVTRLRRLERVRRDFVANVSHELRTPVTAIKGFVETLLDGQEHDPEDVENFLNVVGRQADRLQSIIDDLLTLSRIEQEGERAEVQREPCDLPALVQAVLQACESAANERGVDLVATVAEGRWPANGALLEQALINLVDNAIKYSSAGSVVEITVTSAAELTISVRDHGCGIAAEHLPRLFERFYRVDKARSRKMGGTGLGLAIVKHIVQAHRGRVGVESKPGVGSTFTLHLPA